jgi:hypothetical protein
MNPITIHDPLKAELDAALEPVELIDEAGRRLGHFVPARIAAFGDDCPYSPGELDQMQSERGGRPLKEIWTSLGAK